MTSKEAYLSDLDDLEKEIERLLSLVPVGKTKKSFRGASRQKRQPAWPEPLSPA